MDVARCAGAVAGDPGSATGGLGSAADPAAVTPGAAAVDDGTLTAAR